MDSIHAKKYLGQNFLINKNIKQNIISSCNLKSIDTVLEIGPGKGALTFPLSEKVKKVIAIETDKILAVKLKEKFANTNVEIIHADILKYPFKLFPDELKIISNLPYNIATPIIKKVIYNKQQFKAFYATVQLEYGLRMTAKPNTKEYGSFSCFIQYYTEPKILFKIKNTSFKPVPKVNSCFMSLDILEKPRVKSKNEKLLFEIIRSAFSQRRKTILNSLSKFSDKISLLNIFKELNINPNSRAENLKLNDYIIISDHFNSLIKYRKE